MSAISSCTDAAPSSLRQRETWRHHLDSRGWSCPQVYFLNSELQQNMSKKLNGVPALVIKYDEDFDLNDRDAKEMYAAQVKEYFQWVQALR